MQTMRCSVQLYMTAANQAGNATCTVDMLDSQGDVTDTAQVRFSVNATVTDTVAVSDGTRESLGGGDSGHRTCQEKCGNGIFNMLCFYWNNCKEQLAKAFAVISSSIIIGAH
jgi:hypothetical protein